MSEAPKRFGLELRKSGSKSEVKKVSVAQSFFDDDSDGESSSMEPAGKRFDQKYASIAKKRDQRLVEKALEEDPSVYDYDSIHDKLEEQRHKATLEQKKADKDRKPKYADNIVNAHKKRELERLIHDERTQQKERLAEGEEFDNKEVFITSAYRQQIEERNAFQKELDERDRIDNLTNVADQKLWQSAFQRHMLDLTSRVDDGVPAAGSVKSEVKDEPMEVGKAGPAATTSVKKEVASPSHHESKRSRRPVRNQREMSKEQDRKPRRYERSRSPVKEESGRVASKQNQHTEKKMSEKAREKVEIERRMNNIQEILRRRNGKDQIEELKEKYLERKEQGLIMPPLCQ